MKDYKTINQNKVDMEIGYKKQALINMMKSDEELGLYDDIEINRIEVVCKDCSDSLEDCTCIQDTVEFLKEEPNIISDWLEQNRNPEIDKQVEKELEYLSKQEIKMEDIFNDDKKENIKKFIDEIKNPSELNQALKDAAQRYQERMYSEEEVLEFTQTMIMQYKFGNTNIAQMDLLKETLQQFKNK